MSKPTKIQENIEKLQDLENQLKAIYMVRIPSSSQLKLVDLCHKEFKLKELPKLENRYNQRLKKITEMSDYPKDYEKVLIAFQVKRSELMAKYMRKEIDIMRDATF